MGLIGLGVIMTSSFGFPKNRFSNFTTVPLRSPESLMTRSIEPHPNHASFL